MKFTLITLRWNENIVKTFPELLSSLGTLSPPLGLVLCFKMLVRVLANWTSWYQWLCSRMAGFEIAFPVQVLSMG